jgi:DNA-binding MarR family transcriptional regulator/GNAT superfamily N-acetyltransferase
MAPTTSATDTLRRFNRTWTQRIGALDESFLGLGLPLGVARLLFEIGPEGASVRDLRERLDLDSGYLTRLLRRLEDDALVDVHPDPGDRRRRLVSLTAAGARAWRSLDTRSDALAQRLVGPLTNRQRTRLADALATADLLVRAATVRFSRVDPASATATAAVGHYFAELDRRFPGGFDPGDAAYRGTGDTAGEGRFLVATSDGLPVACGGVHALAPGLGEIKRMWVDPQWRGAGLGSRLLQRLEEEALGLGLPVVRLDTNGTLTEAIAMYERAGYRRIPRYNDNPYAEAWFEKRLDGAQDPARSSS